MGRTYRKNRHKGDKPMKEKYRTKRKTKDIDEIHNDLKAENAKKLLSQPVDLDKPGSGQNYCLHCAKHFVSPEALKSHFKGNQHKRRLKNLSTEPYSQEEADRASGMGSYVPPKKIKVETQSVKEDMNCEPVETNT